MKIISQDKKTIANLETIKITEIDHIGGKYTISVHLQDNYCKKLGEYNTLERAIEVLNGITEADIGGWKRYELPLE